LRPKDLVCPCTMASSMLVASSFVLSSQANYYHHMDEASLLQMPELQKSMNLDEGTAASIVAEEAGCRCPGYFQEECEAEASYGCVWSNAGSSNGPWCQCREILEPGWQAPPRPAPVTSPAPPTPPPSPVWHRWDLTDASVVESVMPQFEPFYRFGNANEHVVFEARGELGLCMAVLEPTPGFGAPTTGPILQNANNHYSPAGGTPFLPRDDSLSASELKGDNACGLALPFSTPKQLRLQMSSVNVVDDNAPTLFSGERLASQATNHSSLSRSHFPVSQGFMGVQTGLPQDISQGASNYETWYIRPSNGAGPGPNQFNPATSVQFCADPGFEWFWLRSHAFDGSDGAVPTDSTTNFVFEGSAQTSFANEDVSAMLATSNTLEYTFDDNSHGVNMVVNGQPAVSAVTNQPIDRTVFGSREPSVLTGSRSAIMFEPGVYLCVQNIEWSM